MVGDAQGSEDVDVVLGLVAVEDDGVGFEYKVRGVDGGVSDSDVGGGVRGEAEHEEDGRGQDGQSDDNGEEEVAACWLGEGKVGHSVQRIAAEERMRL